MVISCGEIINPSPIFNEANASVGMVAKSMTDNSLGEMPIVENVGNMRLVGFIAHYDIVKMVAFGRDARNTPAYEIMTPDPVTCSVKDDLSFALDIMDKCHLRRLPVVSSDKRLLGMIEHDEVLKHVQEQAPLGAESAAEQLDQSKIFESSAVIEVDAM